ncbi:MAG: hypothetical protein CMI02_11770 [Oceanospirillaceae bacterium]|nr:hypothetical protein [Oceanospirillaceae bacterium]MBT12697.1 hypothetical protein [Oceanospirillaceae bacterium]|tara:strand:+ start:92396 stop:92971 length:576 start_codon:yes stop_codon:yes gene_type:complete
MDAFTRQLYKVIGLSAIAAPLAHTITDIWEVLAGGYSVPLLIVNYIAFVVLPFTVIGLYAVQRPAIRMAGLVGALLYAWSFIYFSHTALYALEQQIPDYDTLWQHLGMVYTFHGMLMIAGGLLFGVVTCYLGLFPRWTSLCFIAGILANLVFGLINVPDITQIIGSTVRNLGLMGMGASLLWPEKPGHTPL